MYTYILVIKDIFFALFYFDSKSLVFSLVGLQHLIMSWIKNKGLTEFSVRMVELAYTYALNCYITPNCNSIDFWKCISFFLYSFNPFQRNTFDQIAWISLSFPFVFFALFLEMVNRKKFFWKTLFSFNKIIQYIYSKCTLFAAGFQWIHFKCKMGPNSMILHRF